MPRTPQPSTLHRPAEPVRSWSAARLPKLRDQTVAHLIDPDSFIQVLMRGKSTIISDRAEPMSGPYGVNSAGAAGLPTLAHDLADAALYWVTEPMAALAVSSAQSLDEVRWCAAEQPTPSRRAAGDGERPGSGLLVWDHGISAMDWAGGIKVPLTAVSWHRHCDAGLAVCLYMARHQLAAMMEGYSLRVRGRAVPGVPDALADALGDCPPLIPVWSTEVATTAEWTPVMPSMPFATIMSALYATWVLMMQPGIADQVRQEVEPRVRKAIARTGKPVPDVTLVDLRRKQKPRLLPREEPGDGAAKPGRQYRHQWVVPGFWRNQACGPGWSQHKKIWISDYTKGPDGAPMLARVNVWRR